jgi:hypothetical protein
MGEAAAAHRAVPAAVVQRAAVPDATAQRAAGTGS